MFHEGLDVLGIQGEYLELSGTPKVLSGFLD